MIELVRKEVLERAPAEASLTGIEIEGPQIVLLTKNPEFMLSGQQYASELAKVLRKRVVIRTAPQYLLDEETASGAISSILPKEAGLQRVIFNHSTGEAISIANNIALLEADINNLTQKVAKETGWRLVVEKKFLSDSKTFSQVLHVLTSRSESKSSFLRETGDRIFRTPLGSTSSCTLSFLGGVEQVGRSALLVSTDESKVLVDAGVNPGTSQRGSLFPRFDYEFDGFDSLDAVVVSHAHLDHIGALPLLTKYGYQGPFYMTEPTLYLLTILLEDFYNVETRSGSLSFFSLKDVKSVIEQTIVVKYNQVTDVSPDIKITPYNAGHILGSSLIDLTIGDAGYSVLYTSDFKLGRSLLLNPAVSRFLRVDTLIMESTYGGEGDVMPSRTEVENRLISLVNETFQRGGRVLIPTLAVGRAQEVMLILDRAMANKNIEEAPVFVDGMITEVSKVHSAFPSYLSSELYSLITEEGVNPLESEYFVPIKSSSERSEALSAGKAIVLSTSGMLEGGPVLEYFRHVAPEPKDSVLFVNYQIEGTLGQRVLSGAKQVQLYDGEGKLAVIDIKSQIHRLDGLSGHSDRSQLLTFARNVITGRGSLFLVHGERSKLRSLHRTVSHMFPHRATVPRLGERYRVF